MKRFWKFWWFKASYLTLMSSFVLVCLVYALWPAKVFLWTGIELVVILIALGILLFGSLHQARSKNQSPIENRVNMKAATVCFLLFCVVMLASIGGCIIFTDKTTILGIVTRLLVITSLFGILWSLVIGQMRSVGTTTI